MFQFLVKKFNNRTLSFRTVILILFSTLFMIGMLSLIFITHFRLAESTQTVAYTLAKEKLNDIVDGINDEINIAIAEVNYSTYLLQSNIQETSDFNALAKTTKAFLATKSKILPSIESVFWADPEGDLIHSILHNDAILTEVITLHQPIAARSIAINNAKGESTVRHVTSKSYDYDPRQRPWYQLAVANKKTIVTDLYQHVNFNVPAWGMTIAAPVYRNDKLIGIWGLQLRLNYFHHLLDSSSKRTHGIPFIVTDKGQLVAFQKSVRPENQLLKNITTTTAPGIYYAYQHYQKTGQAAFVFHEKQQKYLAVFDTVKIMGKQHWIIGIVLPESAFTAPIKKTSWMLTGLGLLILLAGLAIISKLASQIVRPLKKLTEEAEQIQQFELSEHTIIPTHIKEIRLLANSLSTMKNGLKSFQQYVPATLVRQILAAGEQANVGGAKKTIVTFFSDIKGFSSIAEKTEPHQLMSHLCAYFDALSGIIQREKGTIDKYIGDAIMAFWGAPQSVTQPCHHAALAALDCAYLVKTLNKKWLQQDLLPFITRIGLHTGEAIIGNLGSHDRLNYTAIGDVVNIASRLQEGNKLYGTHILVSSDVYAEINMDFTLRMVDCVLLKGKAEAQFIYELIGKNSDTFLYNITRYKTIFAEGFRLYQEQKWLQAILVFEHCIEIYSADKVAPLFIKRCEYCKQNPPLLTWNGVWFKDWENS